MLNKIFRQNVIVSKRYH